ncbi:MAG TPA: hypothetical protein VJ939_03465 [Bacteroidales bacterium]|nr:hypothetical protein [Bacteroidales bacterium]
MKNPSIALTILLIVVVFVDSKAQNYFRVNAGYLIPSGEFADKSFEENSGMADEGFGYSVDFSKIYGSGLGWSLMAGKHTNTMDIGNLKQMAEDEFGGEWNIITDDWSYYFVMAGFLYQFSWGIDFEVGVSGGYVNSVSPAIHVDYQFNEQSDQLELPESKSEALAFMPRLRFSYPLKKFVLSLNASTFLARPKFKVTLLDGEEYNVKQYIINSNLGIGIGYKL